MTTLLYDTQPIDDVTLTTQLIKPQFTKATHCCYCTLKFTENSLRIGCPVNQISLCTINGKHCNFKGSNIYDTVGVFCSYSCAKAFAQANGTDPSFHKSEILLAKMYAQQYKITDPIIINPSPSPLLLVKYGGNMSKEQYENEKGRIVYILEGKIASHPMTNIFTKIE